MWSKPLLCCFQQPGKVPRTQVSQGFAASRLAPSRIAPRHTQITCATNCATPGYSFFCHYTTASGKNKDFSVCGHLCGQRRFCAAFCNRGKSRKRRRRKALRRFASPHPGYNHGTPKPRALPVEPHPDIHFSAMIPRRAEKIKFFLSVVIPVVKAAFVLLSATGESPANAGAARLCGVSPHPIPDTTTALPNLSGILFPLVYSGFRRFLICFTYSLTLLFPLFPGTPAPSVVIYVVKNASRPVFGENSPMPDGKRFSLLLAAL